MVAPPRQPHRAAAGRQRLPLFLCGYLVLLAGCGSPNRGTWEGQFDGTVSGVVQFTINTRGTRLTGSMEGRTASGDPFRAEMKGWLEGIHLEAEFAGSSQVGSLPAHFTGLMKGTLVSGEAEGTWEASMRFTQQSLSGSWTTTQRPGS